MAGNEKQAGKYGGGPDSHRGTATIARIYGRLRENE
jgi:hypothetical protein